MSEAFSVNIIHTPTINMSKKRYHNTSTEKRQTDQSPWQPKAYLTS